MLVSCNAVETGVCLLTGMADEDETDDRAVCRSGTQRGMAEHVTEVHFEV